MMKASRRRRLLLAGGWHEFKELWYPPAECGYSTQPVSLKDAWRYYKQGMRIKPVSRDLAKLIVDVEPPF